MNALEKNFDIMTNYNEVVVEHVVFNGKVGESWSKEYNKVAKVLVDKSLSIKEQLEKAYMLTQNIEDGWWNNELVTNISQEDALRSTSVEDMRNGFATISDGEYAKILYSKFGNERVDKELDVFLSNKFIPRSGGGIGVTRLIRSMKMEGLI